MSIIFCHLADLKWNIMSPIKTILFDLDDTLFDHRYCNLQAIAALKTNFECFAKPSLAELERISSDQFEIHWKKVLTSEYSLDRWLLTSIQLLFEQYGDPCDMEIYVSAAQDYRHYYQQARRTISGAIPLLEYLRGKVRIGIVTNHLATEQRDKLACCKLDSLVDFIVCADEVGVPKPDRRIFEVALDRAGCTSEQAVMVGDSWTSDVMGARSVGMRAVWFNPYNEVCLDPLIAPEIKSWEPLDEIVSLLLGVAT
jgi:HAD superfamily hydrolase (TIGR01549 family)